MKILHINTNYATTALHKNLINELERKGIDNYVFVPTIRTSHIYDFNNEKVSLNQCFKRIDSFFYYHKQKKIIRALEDNYKICEFDLLHAYTLMTDGNVAREMYRKYKIPYIVTIRDTDLNYFFKYRKHLIKQGMKILLDAEKIVFLSKSYLKRILLFFCNAVEAEIIKEKSVIISNGVDDFWIKNMGLAKKNIDYSNIQLLYVGKICYRKNVGTLVKVINKLNKEGIVAHLNIIGNVNNRMLYKKINKCKYIKYYEPKRKEELIHYYRNADIFVMPSITETFGLTYVESMTQGTPLIYTINEGFDTQFDEGVVGFHVNPKDYNQICNRIDDIINSYIKLSKNCINLSKKFNWNDVSDRYIKLYRECLNRKVGI